MFFKKEEKYEGEIDENIGMSQCSDSFHEEYDKATKGIRKILDDFETATNRKVENLSIDRLETTGYNTGFKFIEQIRLHIMANKIEVSW